MKIRQKQGPRAKIDIRAARFLFRMIEAEAKKANISMNEWIVRELERATDALRH